MADHPKPDTTEPSYLVLRQYHRRIEAMIADPECHGDLLLVGIAIARHLLNGGGPGDLRDVTVGLLGEKAVGYGLAKGTVRADARRYQMDYSFSSAVCEAPMLRRAGTCGRRATRHGTVVDLDTGERHILGSCSRPAHHHWWAERLAENRALIEEHPPPAPAANKGGVLARHLPEIDWPALWKALDPRWEPPPEADPLPPRVRFTLLPGAGEDTGDDTADGAPVPDLALVRDDTVRDTIEGG